MDHTAIDLKAIFNDILLTLQTGYQAALERPRYVALALFIWGICPCLPFAPFYYLFYHFPKKIGRYVLKRLGFSRDGVLP
ncbi:hypothetical protein AX15_000483, partial [Amanita polypyramis BW_CC]